VAVTSLKPRRHEGVGTGIHGARRPPNLLIGELIGELQTRLPGAKQSVLQVSQAMWLGHFA
jgi:hypothetical protein